MSDINLAGSREILLGLSQEVGDFITNIQTCSDSLNHLFFVEQSDGLSITPELESVDKLISQNGMGTKLNDHGMTFGSQLHRVVFLSTWPI